MGELKKLTFKFLEMLALGAHWQTRHSMVSEQCGTSSHEMYEACGRRLARLISNIRNTAENCRLGLFEHSHFARDLEDSPSWLSQGGTLFIFGSLTFVLNVVE